MDLPLPKLAVLFQDWEQEQVYFDTALENFLGADGVRMRQYKRQYDSASR